jgi:protein-disulfide isomerase
MESSPKNFFERYQVFFALIICGILIGGGLVLSRALPAKQPAGAQPQQTQTSVTNDMLKFGQKAGASKKDLAACLSSKQKEAVINDAVALAEKSGVTGTPTFFIIKRTFKSDGSVASEKQFSIVGARDKDTFLKSINEGKSPADQPQMPAGERIVLSDSDHKMGPAQAEVTIVEYSDIDCPFCKAAKPILDEILREHPEFAFVYRHSPIVSLHPFAAYKAEASECVTDLAGKDAFWKFLDLAVK